MDRDTSLDRAVELFWRRGYHATSLKDIERALGLHPGSIYASFGSKAALFNEALDRYASNMAGELDAILDQGCSRLDGIHCYLRNIARACVPARACDAPPARACMIVKTILEAGDTEPEIAAHANALLDQVEQALTAALRRAKAADELREGVEPRRLARLLQAHLMGLRTFAQRHVSRRAVLQLADDLAASLSAYAVTKAESADG